MCVCVYVFGTGRFHAEDDGGLDRDVGVIFSSSPIKDDPTLRGEGDGYYSADDDMLDGSLDIMMENENEMDA